MSTFWQIWEDTQKKKKEIERKREMKNDIFGASVIIILIGLLFYISQL